MFVPVWVLVVVALLVLQLLSALENASRDDSSDSCVGDWDEETLEDYVFDEEDLKEIR